MACGCCGLVSKKMNKKELEALKKQMEEEYLRALGIKKKAILLERQYRTALVDLYGPPPQLEKC